MKEASEEDQGEEQPRKRATLGNGISAGSGSPVPSPSPPPQAQRSKALRTRPESARYRSNPDKGSRRDIFVQRPAATSGRIWNEQHPEPVKGSSIDPANVAANVAQKLRSQALKARARQTSQPSVNVRSTNPQTAIKPSPAPHFTIPGQEECYDIILQPETRPISQEQLVAEVKGIYAGLVMVEAKCIEVDNEQATLAQADPSAQPKLNNEQWQALIALHRTLIHEHHDFFLASQHPSASPALRRLASKYAMPARMWRHGIHSFLELLRHRLPASLDHMLAFIYLAYSMMALLYETVPAFEDTWIECLGDLGRYRMAIEDDDIRDREVWTGVARHWYSKASDKAPTTGRLYQHLAILARPNTLQQLFYYSKSLSAAVPFTSARESILTLFEPVIHLEHSSTSTHQYRLPPLDTAFVKAHGLLFTDKDMEKFDPTVQEFLGLLDNQIGRVTRKFMEQGYHIAVSNCIAMLGFETKEAILLRTLPTPSSDELVSENTAIMLDQYLDKSATPGSIEQLLSSSNYFSNRWWRKLRRARLFKNLLKAVCFLELIAPAHALSNEHPYAPSKAPNENITESTIFAGTLAVIFCTMKFAKNRWGFNLPATISLISDIAILYASPHPSFTLEQFGAAWFFSEALHIEKLNEMLEDYPRFRALFRILNLASGPLLAGAIVYSLPENLLGSADRKLMWAAGSLPATSFGINLFEAVFIDLGFARKLEDREYDQRIREAFDFVLRNWFNIFLTGLFNNVLNWLFGPRPLDLGPVRQFQQPLPPYREPLHDDSEYFFAGNQPYYGEQEEAHRP